MFKGVHPSLINFADIVSQNFPVQPPRRFHRAKASNASKFSDQRMGGFETYLWIIYKNTARLLAKVTINFKLILFLMKNQPDQIIRMRNDATRIFHAGLRAVEPGLAVKKYCKVEDERLVVGSTMYNLSEFDNIFVVGAGKGSAPMASAIEDLLGEKIRRGIVNVKYGHVAELSRIELIEAGHPVPDKEGQDGANSILNLATDAGENDLVLCLISGGGSALLPLPIHGLTLDDKQNMIKVLLSCGAAIDETNALRKHTSMIKGGGLARAAYPATLVSLILSDVVGDYLDVIASGPTVPDLSTFEDCMKIIDKYNIKTKLSQNIVRHIEAGTAGHTEETPKFGDPIFESTHNLIIGNNMGAILAAKQEAEILKYNTLVLSSMIEGETKEVAKVHSAIAKEILKTGCPLPSPACILSGGETTVTISGTGKGGRNQEFALVAALAISGLDNIVVLSGGTDGNDGPTDAAGAVVDNTTRQKAEALGIDPLPFLANNDSYHFFEKTGDLLITGPTNTNVMDLRIILAV
jgi:hydroxypyruvate reductase